MKNKNLLIIANSFPHKNCPTAGTFTKVQVDATAKYFNKVFVICPTPYMPAFISRFQFIPSSWRKAVNPINYSYNNVSVYFPKFFMLPFNFSRKKAGEKAYKATLKVISRENISFDIIHAHFIHYAGAVGAKLKEKYKKPLIVTSHEDHDFFIEQIKSKRSIFVYSAADKILRVNKRDLNELYAVGVDKDKLGHIPNAFDKYRFYPIDKVRCRKNLSLPNDKIVLLNVANLETYKGHEYLIKAISNVVSKNNDVLCFIVGNGSLKGKLQKLINNLNLNKYVKLLGEKPHDEIPLWMNACDLFVLPSLSESFGVVQIEAMACGKPVVATRNGGSEEIIVNEKLGYLVEPKNPDEMADKILLALNKKWDKEYILNYAKRFSSDEIAREILKVYEKVMY